MANINDFDITIKDVADFFNTIGFRWDGTYYNRKLEEFVEAKTFNDIVSHYPKLTKLKLCLAKFKNEYYIDFYISPTKFIRYRDETNIMGSGSSVYIDKDYSARWGEFIDERKNSQNIEQDTIFQAK